MEREGRWDSSVVELVISISALEEADFSFGGVDFEIVVNETMVIQNFMRISHKLVMFLMVLAC